MKISNLKIQNYRNIRDINIELGDNVVFIGSNNSGKTNILKALTLPFLSNEIGYNGKNLSWSDINNESKSKYYQYVLQHQNDFLSNSVDEDEFMAVVPKVSVTVTLNPGEKEVYFVKDLVYEVDTDSSTMQYGIKYEFSPKNIKALVSRIKEVIQFHNDTIGTVLTNETIENIQMNLLPVDLYNYSINVPNKNTNISYEILRYFKYTSLIAERDEFSQTTERLGSKALVKLLQMKLEIHEQVILEREYTKFFDELKKITNMEDIINWPESSEIKNAKNLFKQMSILPNIPNMNLLLNSVKLGYDGEHLSSHGLGHRNLILLFILLNSFISQSMNEGFSVVTLEEPEAHLCINNQKMLSSYINVFTDKENSTQLFYSTHSVEFINKLDFSNVILVNKGEAISLINQLRDSDMDYLSKTPNLDLYKFFFSKKCILVEGLTEELFIRSYLRSKLMLHEIEVISFHKGFKTIIDIWNKLNVGTDNKLGIVRDFDNQGKAKEEHEAYNVYPNICVRTTGEYTLEPEIAKTGKNFELLKKYFEESDNITQEELVQKWISGKSDTMLQLCKNIENGTLTGLEMPRHIQEIIEFLIR